MTKSEFLHQLRTGLHRLPPEEVEGAMRYYVEYLDESGDENWEQVQQELGTPQAIAAQILADYAVKDMNASPPSAKKGLSAVWFVLLALLAAPIALPIALVLVALVLALFIVALAVILVVFAVVLTFFVVGVAATIGSLLVVPVSFSTFLLMLGSGLALLALSILFLVPSLYLAKALFRGIADLASRLLNRRRAHE